MKDKKTERGIVVFDVSSRTFDVFKDVSDAAERLDTPVSTLHSWLPDIHYTGSCFVGEGTIYRSGRGGPRVKKGGKDEEK
jgi:hypothetical protein